MPADGSPRGRLGRAASGLGPSGRGSRARLERTHRRPWPQAPGAAWALCAPQAPARLVGSVLEIRISECRRSGSPNAGLSRRSGSPSVAGPYAPRGYAPAWRVGDTELEELWKCLQFVKFTPPPRASWVRPRAASRRPRAAGPGSSARSPRSAPALPITQVRSEQYGSERRRLQLLLLLKARRGLARRPCPA